MARPRKDSSGGKTAKEKLIGSAFQLIRSKGYSAATVDEFCAAAGVTKGTFFHYFVSKEDLAIQAARYWSQVTGEFFANSPYQLRSDPLDRFIGYLEFRRDIIQGEIAEFTCLAGTMAQEIYDSHPQIREACRDSIFDHAAQLEKDIIEAIELHRPLNPPDPKSLALHSQAVLQGGFILAKASGSREVAMACVDHLIQYVKLIFQDKKN